MSTKTFRIQQPGMLTTVQDTGRLGYQRLGVPVAGAMDTLALRAGNRLVGNIETSAGIEATFMGPAISVLADAIIAVTGADLGAALNGVPLPLWQTAAVKAGDSIGFSGPVKGVRAYICVAGGIDVPVVMNSRSTYLRSKIGGHLGRALKQDDVLEIGQPGQTPPIGSRLTPQLMPQFPNPITLRVVMGPQDDMFTEQGVETLLTSEYSVTPQMDRMGIRLEGATITHKQKADIISDGISLGSIQVPGNGQPIVMMADHQTTGGYTKIATVMSVDVPKLAQAQPGDKVRFKKVSVEEAHAAYKKQEELLSLPLVAPEPSVSDVGAQNHIQTSVGEEQPTSAAHDGEVIIVEHEGKRYTVSANDGSLTVYSRRHVRPKRYRISVEGKTYDVEIR